MIPKLEAFRETLPSNPQDIAAAIIGKGLQYDRGCGKIEMVYADYIASGRALTLIEDFMRHEVLPFYANSHTEDSFCGGVITGLREAARAEIARLCGASEEHAVIFGGGGATAGLNRLPHLFGVKRRWFERPSTVLIGPYEHHSNILPWREAGARVVEIPEAPGGGVDLEALDRALSEARGRVVGAFSAMSNVSGILTDVIEVTRRLKRAGALAVWDYAGGAPYLPVDISPAPDAQIDAISVSPHKFIGGPGASGVLIVRRDAVRATRPTVPGGGTVRFVSSAGHDYHRGLELREEGGTPNVLGDIRAALVFLVKEAIGVPWIQQRNRDLSARLYEVARQEERIEIMGLCDAERVPILSFRIKGATGYHNYKYATTVLSDQFGVQARGGCACAGPYVFRLAGLPDIETHAVRQEIAADDFSRKPGFVRLNLSAMMSDAEIEVILNALRKLPEALDEYVDHYERSGVAGPYRRKSSAA